MSKYQITKIKKRRTNKPLSQLASERIDFGEPIYINGTDGKSYEVTGKEEESTIGANKVMKYHNQDIVDKGVFYKGSEFTSYGGDGVQLTDDEGVNITPDIPASNVYYNRGGEDTDYINIQDAIDNGLPRVEYAEYAGAVSILPAPDPNDASEIPRPILYTASGIGNYGAVSYDRKRYSADNDTAIGIGIPTDRSYYYSNKNSVIPLGTSEYVYKSTNPRLIGDVNSLRTFINSNVPQSLHINVSDSGDIGIDGQNYTSSNIEIPLTITTLNDIKGWQPIGSLKYAETRYAFFAFLDGNSPQGISITLEFTNSISSGSSQKIELYYTRQSIVMEPMLPTDMEYYRCYLSISPNVEIEADLSPKILTGDAPIFSLTQLGFSCGYTYKVCRDLPTSQESFDSYAFNTNQYLLIEFLDSHNNLLNSFEIKANNQQFKVPMNASKVRSYLVISPNSSIPQWVQGETMMYFKFHIEGVPSGYLDYYLLGVVEKEGRQTLYSVPAQYTQTGMVTEAMWNDYAEGRNCPYLIKPGMCMVEAGGGKVRPSEDYLETPAGIASNTHGMFIGSSVPNAKPIAVAGRVLAFVEDKKDLKVGDALKTAPNGKVAKMTKREMRKHPDKIVGYVSEFPTYENYNNVPVNGRIWVRVK